MEAKLLKIELNFGARSHLESLITYMRENIEYPKKEMEQKGYFWDSVFFEQIAGVDFLYIVIKSNDFSNIMIDERELIATPFREIYEQFRVQCWAPKKYIDIESLFCFNTTMTFSN